MTRRGFTLIEVVIAMALIIALIGAAWTFFFQLLQTRDQATRIGRQQLAATTLIERVESDLAACLVGDAHFGAGVSGDAGRLSVLTRAVPASLAEQGPEASAVFADLERAEYRFVAGAGEVRVSRAVLTGSAGASPRPAELGGPLHLVRFRFHDGSGWREQFDSLAQDRLPLAVEIAVWFEPWEEPETDESAMPDEELGFDDLGFDDLGFDPTDPGSEPVDSLTSAGEPSIPRPDRLRVIPIPDAVGEDDGESAEAEELMP